MDRDKLAAATSWVQSVLNEIAPTFPKVRFIIRFGQDGVYDLMVEGSPRLMTVGLSESTLYELADGNEAIRSEIAQDISALARYLKKGSQ